MNEHILARVPGAVAYFVFSAEGQRLGGATIDSGRLDDGTLDMLGHVCVANKAIANLAMRGWEGVSGITGFYPVESFVFVGTNLSIVAGNSHAFVLDNEAADYEAAQRVLSELEN